MVGTVANILERSCEIVEVGGRERESGGSMPPREMRRDMRGGGEGGWGGLDIV